MNWLNYYLMANLSGKKDTNTMKDSLTVSVVKETIGMKKLKTLKFWSIMPHQQLN